MATDNIWNAFAADSDLATRVANAYIRCQSDPELSQVFIDIAAFVNRTQKTSSISSIVVPEPQSKKRKLDTNGAPSTHEISNPTTFFACKDVSFTIPARKKLKLELLASSSDRRGQVRLVDSKTESVEYTIDADDIEQTFCLPVPDKAQRQQNYIIIPKESAVLEQVVFTMNEAPDKTGTITARNTAAQEGETIVDVTTKELTSFLSRQGVKLTQPDEKEFASSIPQSHRKGEKAFHVKAFRGSKDGYLFFLPNGIFFGFKKPLLFFSFGNVESISYTSVLQRTFNLVITPHSEDGSVQDVEFSMLDQADFAGIDEYIKAHGLNDASMAAERRAKMYNVNKEPKAEQTKAEQVEDDGQTELQKAEQQLQDEEDELEEDYDPSGGESDGEGEESDDEAYDNDEGYADDADEDAEGAEEEE